MKFFLIATNLATVGLLAFLYFNGNIGFSNNRAAKCNTCTNICADYSGKGITRYDIGVLKKMSDDDKNAAGFKKARNIWFSLDTLKRFIWNIEKNTCGLPCGKDNTFSTPLGIRIYFARYPNAAEMKITPDLQNVDPLFAEQQTLFMIPTFDNVLPTGVQHVDFDPTNTGTFSSINCVFQKIDGSSGQVAALGINHPPPPVSGAVNNTTAQNHGGLCPPVCSGGEAFR